MRPERCAAYRTRAQGEATCCAVRPGTAWRSSAKALRGPAVWLAARVTIAAGRHRDRRVCNANRAPISSRLTDVHRRHRGRRRAGPTPELCSHRKPIRIRARRHAIRRRVRHRIQCRDVLHRAGRATPCDQPHRERRRKDERGSSLHAHDRTPRDAETYARSPGITATIARARCERLFFTDSSSSASVSSKPSGTSSGS
jgi:hypothetical protein